MKKDPLTVERLKVKEVAEILAVSEDKVLDLVDSGAVRSWRFGPKTLRISRQSVIELLELSEV